jgi:hypothetical protein
MVHLSRRHANNTAAIRRLESSDYGRHAMRSVVSKNVWPNILGVRDKVSGRHNGVEEIGCLSKREGSIIANS